MSQETKTSNRTLRMVAGVEIAYECDSCGAVLVTLTAERGIVLSVVDCQAIACDGRMKAREPTEDDPDYSQEWFKPVRRERRAMRGSQREYADQGGLFLRDTQ